MVNLARGGSTNNGAIPSRYIQVTMLEELGSHLGYSVDFLPPLDGEWGAVGEDGTFSGNNEPKTASICI